MVENYCTYFIKHSFKVKKKHKDVVVNLPTFSLKFHNITQVVTVVLFHNCSKHGVKKFKKFQVQKLAAHKIKLLCCSGCSSYIHTGYSCLK